MKKKVLKSYLIAAVLSMALCACGSDLADEGAVKEIVAAGASESAGEEPEAKETPKAVATATPKPTEVPKTTAAATETSKPAVTAAPKTTATPTAAEVPKATATPKTATASAATVAPEATTTAKPTAAPTATMVTVASASEGAESAVTANQPETPAEPVHTHTFVDRTVSEATCTEAKVVESVCSVCGESNGTRTEGSALGHVYGYDSWWFEPTCSSGGYKNEICGICGADMGGVSVDPLPHDWEETSTTGYDCVTSGVTRQTCKSCGAPGDSWENGQYGDHNWVEYSYDEYEVDESAPEGEKIKLVHHEGTQCSICGEKK